MKALFIFIHFLHILVSLFPFPFPFFLPAFLVYSLHCLHSSLTLFLPSFLLLRWFSFFFDPQKICVWHLSPHVRHLWPISAHHGVSLRHLYPVWVALVPSTVGLCRISTRKLSPYAIYWLEKKGTFYWNFTSSVPSIQGDLPSWLEPVFFFAE